MESSLCLSMPASCCPLNQNLVCMCIIGHRLAIPLSIPTFYASNIFNTIIEFLDILHRPAFCLKHNVSETGICFLLRVKAYCAEPNRYLEIRVQSTSGDRD
jgi:hypothetical protein